MTMPNDIPPARPPRAGALRANRIMLRLTRHWLRVITLVVGVYALLPFVTPVLMEIGLTGPARVLYTVYAPFCHQFAFRSLFLFGEQAAYPRAISGADAQPFEVFAATEPEFLSSYEFYYRRYHGNQPPPAPPTAQELAGPFTPWLQFASKDFVGSPTMGYKTTLCARDVAIYLAIFIGALLYSIPRVRSRLRPAPLLLYFLLGIVPIAVDGLSQLLGYPPFNLWPPRETLPAYRIVTGALFGLMNAWLALPWLEQSLRETRLTLEYKLRRAGLEA